MMKKIAIGVLVAVLAVGLAGYLWLRSTFAQETVRVALASQISSAIGQPVSIESIGVSLFPRVAVKLTGVSIGQPPRIQAKSLRLGTEFRALLSRRIVHGTVHLDGARVELPLPAFGSAKESASPRSGGSLPVEIVSIDEIVLNNGEVVSGGRTLRGDFVLVPHGTGATIQKVSLSAEETQVSGTGEIKDVAGPVGEISLNARSLNFLRLLDFFTTFSSKSGMNSSSPAPTPSSAPIDLTVALHADRATMGGLVLEKLGSRTRVTRQGVVLNPIEFGVFGGSYKGTMALAPAPASTLRLNAALSNIDVAVMTAFAGSPDVISGRMSGRTEVTVPGAAVSGVIKSARGTARIEITNGVIKRLGLVKSIVIATSGRADAKSSGRGSSDEPFSQLNATLTFANGTAQTNDLKFESPDLLMSLAGSFELDGSALGLKGNVQLSDELSKQAGRDLVRYTQQEGRVTLPVTISGPAQQPNVVIDVASLAGRAIANKAKEEIKKRIGGLFGR